jgi:hypothetical protein
VLEDFLVRHKLWRDIRLSCLNGVLRAFLDGFHVLWNVWVVVKAVIFSELRPLLQLVQHELLFWVMVVLLENAVDFQQLLFCQLLQFLAIFYDIAEQHLGFKVGQNLTLGYFDAFLQRRGFLLVADF